MSSAIFLLSTNPRCGEATVRVATGAKTLFTCRASSFSPVVIIVSGRGVSAVGQMSSGSARSSALGIDTVLDEWSAGGRGCESCAASAMSSRTSKQQSGAYAQKLYPRPSVPGVES